MTIVAATVGIEASAPVHRVGENTVTTNRLATEKSPYLLQHASNPVDWYPWGDEAFEKAAKEDKPVFLSIGYATCHWCHVMEHESFEDPIVASLMNEAFVNVKVDREERPDIDQVYMAVCQMLTGSGGWPLTIIMTPDKKPFFAATYIPKQSRYGRMGMVDLVPRVQQFWQSDRDKLMESANQIVGRLGTANRNRPGEVPAGVVDAAFEQLAARFDAPRGGFGDRPKFPSPHNLLFLLNYWARTGEAGALQMTEKTLEAMRLGGIFDHVGFGFHRYSTDSEWLVPHFEKMLYDQAMLALAYTDAAHATGSADSERVVREVLAYVLRDMTSPEGAFYSAEDADSEGEEGLFYLWTVDEIVEVLEKNDGAFAVDLWNADPEGNYLDEATQRKNGTNILHLQETFDDASSRLQIDRNQLDARAEAVRAALFARREGRIHPLKDDKILADWNGLMAAAMARAGKTLHEPDYVGAAAASVDFVLTTMRTPDGNLLHRYRDGEAAVDAFLDDYAFLTWACLELYDATLDPAHLKRAIELQDETDLLFWDEADGGYFLTSDRSEALLVRPKESYDGAIPSGNSVAMNNLVRLGRLTGRTSFTDRADGVASAFSHQLQVAPSAHSHLVAGVQAAAGPSLEIVIAGTPGEPDTVALLDVVRSEYLPNSALLLVAGGEHGETIRALAPYVAHHAPVDGKAAAYVCRNFACERPTTDPDRLRATILDAIGKENG